MAIEQAANWKQPVTGDGSASERLSDQACAVSKDIQGMATAVKDLANEKLDACQENTAAAYEEGRVKVCEASRMLERFIKEQPLTSVLIASGVGLFLGRFWSRS